MAVLYDRSVTWGGLVVGTGNKTESLIGYTTLFGDTRLRVQPDRRPVQEPGPPAGRRRSASRTRSSARRPSADLWPGQTDETEGGFSYPMLDRLLFWRIDKRRSIEEMVGARLRRGARRAGRPDGRRRRVQAPGPADRQARAADGRRRLPVPAPAARVGARVTVPTRRRRRRAGRRHAVRRRDADRQPRRRHAAGARGPAGRAAHRGRGHAPHAGGCSTATRSRRG